MGKSKKEKKLDKTLRKLARKREAVVKWLREKNIEVIDGATDHRKREVIWGDKTTWVDVDEQTLQ